MAFKGTTAEWLGTLGISAIFVAWITDSQVPSEWVTAVATSVLAIAAVIGLAGVLWPIQEERRKRRRVHFGKLKSDVLQYVSQELLNTKGVLSRRFSPISWNNGHGLHVNPNPVPGIIFQHPLVQADPEPYKHQYNHTKTYHYQGLLGRYELFMVDYKELLNDLLALAQDIENMIKTSSTLQEDDGRLTPACSHGNLALFAFETLWHPSYLSMDVVRERTNVDHGWVLRCNMTQYAHGTETEMRAEIDLIGGIIQAEDRNRYTMETDKFRKRLDKLLSDFAVVTSSDKLEGECDATRD